MTERNIGIATETRFSRRKALKVIAGGVVGGLMTRNIEASVTPASSQPPFTDCRIEEIPNIFSEAMLPWGAIGLPAGAVVGALVAHDRPTGEPYVTYNRRTKPKHSRRTAIGAGLGALVGGFLGTTIATAVRGHEIVSCVARDAWRVRTPFPER